MDATYRADLRELNELTFARFDAKLEQRVADLRREIGEVKAEFHRELGAAKAELIKWMFVFWAPAALALIGLYFKG